MPTRTTSPQPSIYSRSPTPNATTHHIGIDLGTTFMRMASYHRTINDVRFIPNERDQRKTPCYIAFPDDIDLLDSGKLAAEPVVGVEAQKCSGKYMRATVSGWRSLM